MAPRAAAIRVLVVDDDEAFLSAVTAVIADRQIAVVGTARSGEEALARVEELQPDVIVLDVGSQASLTDGLRHRDNPPSQGRKPAPDVRFRVPRVRQEARHGKREGVPVDRAISAD
jgi:hypothetical protein